MTEKQALQDVETIEEFPPSAYALATTPLNGIPYSKVNGNQDGLTPEQVEQIRALSKGAVEVGKGRISHARIAEHYGIDVGHVKYIANREKEDK
jgi:hypothetical protein